MYKLRENGSTHKKALQLPTLPKELSTIDTCRRKTHFSMKCAGFINHMLGQVPCPVVGQHKMNTMVLFCFAWDFVFVFWTYRLFTCIFWFLWFFCA